MTRREHPECPFAAEVEAGHDGRLGAVDVARLDRHAATCPSCRSLRARLDAVRAEARRAADVGVGDLEQRRARATLLQRAAQTEPPPTWTRPRLAPVLAGALALLVAGGALWRKGGSGPPPRHPLARVEAAAQTTWSRGADEREERIRLTEGVIRVAVPHQHQGHRFRVDLPDGQIEVRGTRFEVEVRGHHTRRVDVDEGLVALRLHDRPELLLAAGSRWVPSPASTAVVARREAAPEAPSRPSVEPPSTPRPAARPLRPAASPDALSSYVSGLRALQRGDLAIAAGSFADFERARPTDERAEDAGYLRLIALRRAGATAEARSAAESYLRRYPHGARRWEALAHLAGSGGTALTCDELAALSTELGGDPARRSAIDPLLSRCRPQ